MLGRLRERLSSLILAVAALLFFLPLGSRALWDSDEGRYAAIAREMLETGDWLVPHLNSVIYLEKPPFMYWLNALSLRVFGLNEWGARFWCAVFGWLTLWLTMRLGRLWRDKETGDLAGIILGTSVLFFALTQYLVLDMALTFWMTFILLCIAHILRGDTPARLSTYAHLGAIAAAGGFLTKGLVAFVLPVSVAIATTLWSKHRHVWRDVPWKGPLAFLALLTLPWILWMSVRYDAFSSFFFVHEHVVRFLTRAHDRHEPFWFFLPVLLIGALPWSVFLPGVISSGVTSRIQASRDPLQALWIFAVTIPFLFFSVSQSKLVAYILPVFPALALLVADRFQQAWKQSEMPPWLGRGLAALCFIFVLVLMVLKVPPTFVSFPAWSWIPPAAGFLGLMLGFGVFILVGVWGMRRTSSAFWGVVLAQVLLLVAGLATAPALNDVLSTRRLAGAVISGGNPSDTLLTAGAPFENYLHSLVFYTGRRLVIYGDPGELTLGRDHAEDTGRWFAADSDFPLALEKALPKTWVVTTPERWTAVSPRFKGAYRLVAENARLLLFRKIGGPDKRS